MHFIIYLLRAAQDPDSSGASTLRYSAEDLITIHATCLCFIPSPVSPKATQDLLASLRNRRDVSVHAERLTRRGRRRDRHLHPVRGAATPTGIVVKTASVGSLIFTRVSELRDEAEKQEQGSRDGSVPDRTCAGAPVLRQENKIWENDSGGEERRVWWRQRRARLSVILSFQPKQLDDVTGLHFL